MPTLNEKFKELSSLDMDAVSALERFCTEPADEMESPDPLVLRGKV